MAKPVERTGAVLAMALISILARPATATDPQSETPMTTAPPVERAAPDRVRAVPREAPDRSEKSQAPAAKPVARGPVDPVNFAPPGEPQVKEPSGSGRPGLVALIETLLYHHSADEEAGAPAPRIATFDPGLPPTAARPKD